MEVMVAVFVRGADQAEFVSRLRGVSGDRVLLVPVDVGKRSAMSMVANQLGEVIVDPFEFLLDRAGVDLLLDRVADAEEAGDAAVVRLGIEAAGRCVRRCESDGWFLGSRGHSRRPLASPDRG